MPHGDPTEASRKLWPELLRPAFDVGHRVVGQMVEMRDLCLADLDDSEGRRRTLALTSRTDRVLGDHTRSE